MDPAAYVLRDFEPAEQAGLPAIVDDAVDAIEMFVIDGIGATMNKFNSQVRNKTE